MKKQIKSRTIKFIVVHCTAGNMNATKEDVLNVFYKDRGWKRPGYHYLITADGVQHSLVPERQLANGAQGYNANSIHIAYTGGVNQKDMRTPQDTRTPAQKRTLVNLLHLLKRLYPQARVLGHRDLPKVHKACPSFDVTKEYGREFCKAPLPSPRKGGRRYPMKGLCSARPSYGIAVGVNLKGYGL